MAIHLGSDPATKMPFELRSILLYEPSKFDKAVVVLDAEKVKFDKWKLKTYNMAYVSSLGTFFFKSDKYKQKIYFLAD